MRITAIELHNWLRFVGDHRLELEAKAYAVHARWHDDPTRSNWGGKSSLAEAVRFALWGWHRHATEDEWITAGHPFGEVRLELSDGSTIVRRRERGKRTTLSYQGHAAHAGAAKDEAQRIIAEVVGLGDADYMATCHFEQRQMARLVLADPASRMELVAGWLRLGPLEQCAERASAEGAELAAQQARLEGRRTGAEETVRRALAERTRSEIEDERLLTADVAEAARVAVRKSQDDLERNARLLGLRGSVEDFERLVADGIKLRAEVDGVDGGKLEKEHDDARAAELESAQRQRMARTQLAEKRALSQGRFNGRCPVAGIECPATDQINRDRKRGLELYEVARQTSDAAQKAYDDACRREAHARSELQAHERLASKLDAMREQASRLQPAYEGAKEAGDASDPIALRRRLDDAARRFDELVTAQADLQRRLDVIDEGERILAELGVEIAGLASRVATHRAATVILGKQGAQRRIAEAALGGVEEAANAMLAEAGVDLTVGLRWSREGQGLARSCPACGHPFPASAKAKVCERCQAARGPNLVNKLDVVLSDRSGAAEDLAGIFLQLAASEWLRVERGASWGVVVVDEAFGALDPANRRALGRAFAGALAASSEQALVIAHSPEVLAALPGQIEVVAGPEHSSVRVVA